jgi:hypothetical protein
MSKTELKPCPFCGSEKMKVEGKYKKKWSYEGVGHITCAVRCNKCHARGGTASGYVRNAVHPLTERGEEVLEMEYQIRGRAIEAWNRRADNEQRAD